MVLKSVVIHDDLAFLSMADAMLQRVGRQPNVDARWNVVSLRMSALNYASSAERSLIEAADAQLVVIPAKHAWNVPGYLREWLERWAAIRQIQEAALAVIDDGTQSGFSRTVSPALTALIQKHGLNLIVDADHSPASTPRMAVHFPLKSKLPRSLEVHFNRFAVARESFRGFGINE